MSPTSVPVPTRSPAVDPPPGVKPNFDNPDSLAKWSHVTVGVCIPVATLFFALRAYARIWLKQSWIFEDWLATLGWVGILAFCGVVASVMGHHGGVHAWDLTVENTYIAQYWFNAASILYSIVICTVKLSILFLYRRIFSPRRWSPFDIAIQALIVLFLGFYISTALVKIFECTPREKIFNRNLAGTCINIPLLLNTSGLFNTITDFVILFIPVKAVWNLNMKPRKKAIVVVVFTFGLCAPIFSIVGFIVRIRISNNPDTTWHQPEILLWGVAEITSGYLCVCFPELGTLFRQRPARRPSGTILASEPDRRVHVSRSRPYTTKGHNGKGESHSDLTANPGPYAAIDDDNINMYSVSIAPVRTRNEEPQEGHVHVRQEITVTER